MCIRMNTANCLIGKLLYVAVARVGSIAVQRFADRVYEVIYTAVLIRCLSSQRCKEQALCICLFLKAFEFSGIAVRW